MLHSQVLIFHYARILGLQPVIQLQQRKLFIILFLTQIKQKNCHGLMLEIQLYFQMEAEQIMFFGVLLFQMHLMFFQLQILTLKEEMYLQHPGQNQLQLLEAVHSQHALIRELQIHAIHLLQLKCLVMLQLIQY